MAEFSADLLGSVVVIDDKVEHASGALAQLLGEFHDTRVPVLAIPYLPDAEDVSRWRNIGLVVLDWEFEDPVSATDDFEMPAGIAKPAGVAERAETSVLAVLDQLLADLYVPVFIFSAASEDDIRGAISDLSGTDRAILDRRVRIYSKSTEHVDVASEIAEWFRQVPSLQVLRAWETAVDRARIDTFRELETASVDWVLAVAKSAEIDHEPLETALADVITRNVLSRMGALSLDVDLAEREFVSGEVARRVLHRRAVLPRNAIEGSNLTAGDLLVLRSEESSGGDPETIYVAISPECDLVPRAAGDGSVDAPEKIRSLFVVARKQNRRSAKKMADAVRKAEETKVSHALLSAGGSLYEIDFKDWEVLVMPTGSPDGVYVRTGRLLEPYLSQLQRAWTAFLGRKGVPALPPEFFE